MESLYCTLETNKILVIYVSYTGILKSMSSCVSLLQSLYPPCLQIPEFLNRHTEKVFLDFFSYMVRSERNCPTRPSLEHWRVTGLDSSLIHFTMVQRKGCSWRGRGFSALRQNPDPVKLHGGRKKKGGSQGARLSAPCSMLCKGFHVLRSLPPVLLERAQEVTPWNPHL